MADMLSVAEALRHVVERAAPLPAERFPLARALDRILARNVVSDVDSPPYDKSMMDGFALRVADATTENVRLRVVETIMAGMVPTRALAQGEAARIMTGAPIPVGCDAVTMIERTTPTETTVAIHEIPRPGQNILRRATSLRIGETVLNAGMTLNAARIGLCAEVGCANVLVHRAPTVAILSTGDELVPVEQLPGTGQIRNSNGALLSAAVVATGATPIALGIARDTLDDLRAKIQQGLAADVLVLSGGVSAGDLDLVPGVLESLGVVPHFHKIKMKPGKPLFFGTLTTESSDGARRTCLVFGLPGNPVSSAVCCELFVKPALRRLAGGANVAHATRAFRLNEATRSKGDRPTYHPAVWVDIEGERRVRPLQWGGSADLRTYAQRECLIVFPPGENEYAAGAEVEVLVE